MHLLRPFITTTTTRSLLLRTPAPRPTSASSLFTPSIPRPWSVAAATRKMATHSDPSCIFCKIIKGEIPSFKLYDSEKSYAFMDIGPLSKGHCLVIPKYHGRTLQDIPDEHLGEILVVVKKLATATGATDYNVLQNNGRIAHQVVDHVHFHMIPKPNEEEGLGIKWPAQKADMEELKKYFEEVKSKM